MQATKEILNMNRFFGQAKLTSKYLVEKTYVLSSQKKILVISTQKLTFFPMNMIAEKSEVIEMNDIS